MNAGAYGGEMKDVVESVVVYYVPTQALTEVRGSDCGFEYRRSGFEKINCAIMGAVFKLTPDDPEAIGARMKEMNEKRTASQPLDMPSAGSAFKRPVGGYFISLDAMPGCAKRTLALCKEAGVTMTGAGATFPYGVDPNDSNIRIAPSFPPVAELEQAIAVFCTCLKLAALEKLGI